MLAVRQQVVELGAELHVGPPKTRAGVRVLPMDPSTVAVLVQRRLDQYEEQREWGAGWQDTGLVFTKEDGSVLRPEFVSRHFRSLTRAVGLPSIRFHDLRHTSASLALAAGVAMKVVSDRLGHSTTGITADLYTHVSPVVARDAAAAIAALVEASAARSEGEMRARSRPAITRGRLAEAIPQVSGGRGIRTHEEDRSP
ncbi:MAG: integrase family protein [Mycobacterium sp.]|nr:integrase family protein [Mycobacterium sp.]